MYTRKYGVNIINLEFIIINSLKKKRPYNDANTNVFKKLITTT